MEKSSYLFLSQEWTLKKSLPVLWLGEKLLYEKKASQMIEIDWLIDWLIDFLIASSMYISQVRKLIFYISLKPFSIHTRREILRY